MKTSICLFSVGALSSRISRNKSMLLLGGILSSSVLFYSGSMMEFINLSSGQELSKKKPGYWMINGGVIGVGLAIGAFTSILKSKLHK